MTRHTQISSLLARALSNLAICLSELGQWEEALTVAQEAVELYRALAAAQPEAFRPDLASSLIACRAWIPHSNELRHRRGGATHGTLLHRLSAQRCPRV